MTRYRRLAASDRKPAHINRPNSNYSKDFENLYEISNFTDKSQYPWITVIAFIQLH